MKNLVYISILSLSMILVSCEKKQIDNWFTETYEYSGRFTTAIDLLEYPNPAYEGERLSIEEAVDEGVDFQIYNSAANVVDEIWIDDVSEYFPFRAKFKLTEVSTPGAFSSLVESNNFHEVYYFGEDFDPFTSTTIANGTIPAPTAAGQREIGFQEYARVVLNEAKIIPKGATTIGGNVTDSIYVKFTLKSDNISFISVQTDPAGWKNPSVPEFEWKVEPNTNVYDPTSDEVWALRGYRYSGYPEDR